MSHYRKHTPKRQAPYKLIKNVPAQTNYVQCVSYLMFAMRQAGRNDL